MLKSPYGRAALICWLVGGLCLWASFAAAQDRPLTAATVTLASLAAVDLVQSVPCVRSAACHEVNPLYARLAPAPFVALKAGGMATVITTAWRIRRRRPKTAYVLLLGMTALQGLVVAHNATVK